MLPPLLALEILSPTRVTPSMTIPALDSQIRNNITCVPPYNPPLFYLLLAEPFIIHNQGTPEQKAQLARSYKRKVEYHHKIDGPIWNGEFGPVNFRLCSKVGCCIDLQLWQVYASPDNDPEWEATNEKRYHLLKDQLELYHHEAISWSIWLYKDIGFQGMVYASPESPYIKLLKPFLDKKKGLVADEWGANASIVKDIFDPLEEWLLGATPGVVRRYPPTWTPARHGTCRSADS